MNPWCGFVNISNRWYARTARLCARSKLSEARVALSPDTVRKIRAAGDPSGDMTCCTASGTAPTADAQSAHASRILEGARFLKAAAQRGAAAKTPSTNHAVNRYAHSITNTTESAAHKLHRLRPLRNLMPK